MSTPFRSRSFTWLAVGALLATLLGQTGTANAAAGIHLAPAYAPANHTFKVKGSGFLPGETVQISFEATAIGSATADGAGAFAKSVRVPLSATPGAYTVSADGQTSSLHAQEIFVVAVPSDWGQFRRDAAHTGYNQLETTLDVTNVGGLKLAWSRPVDDWAYASPAVVKGVVYMRGIGGDIQAFDAFTGASRWTVTGDCCAMSSPAVVKGVVYIGSIGAGDSWRLYALDAKTGTEVWSQPVGDLNGSPAVAGGVVYYPVEWGQTVMAFDALDGTELWSADAIGGNVPGSPAVANGLVYVGATDNTLYALDAANGDPSWTAEGGYDLFASPAVSNGIVYAADLSGGITLYDAATGSWIGQGGQSPGSHLVFSSPAVAEGVLFASTMENGLDAFDAATGDFLHYAGSFTGSPGDVDYSSPAVANGVVYAGSKEGWLFALDADTGDVLWSEDVGFDVRSSPAIANGMLYVGVGQELRAYSLYSAK